MTTPAYSELVTSLLASDPSSAKGIIKTLVQRKLIPEAGSVILRSINSVPQFMRTFSASIVAGISRTSPSSSTTNLNAKLSGAKGFTERALTQSSASPVSVDTVPNQDDNDWDAAGNDWSDVEQSDMPGHVASSSSEPSGNKSYSLDGGLPSEKKQLNSDGWSVQDGWDNWSDDELEKIDSEKKYRDELSGGDFQNKPKCISPPLLPSPRSAFARVPPREHTNAGESSSSQLEDATPPASASGTDWDNEDWDANW